ncbi:MAG: hypothetical protein MUD14_22660 [Hydrococcus sp. Prado102]|jgi:hypothetical protein|nr:hypothetical protein [Hydrococcus sp. Prado102]
MSKLSLPLVVLSAMAITFIPQTSLKAQTGTTGNQLGNEIPSQPPQPTNQQLDYRTPQQIFLRRENNATITCEQSNSSTCSEVQPQYESLQENENLRQIREQRPDLPENSTQ